MTVVFLLFFSDEGNTISEESSFSLTLFDSRNFEVAFTNTKEYIQIKFKKNKYFNVTLFLMDFGKYENYRYFNANTYEYVYIFRNNLTKLNVEFKFTRIGNFSDYYNFLIDYSGLKEDYKDETQDSQKLEEDETQNSSAAVIFATVLAYISFALIIFPIIIFLFYMCGLCEDIINECNLCDLCTISEGGIDCAKFKAVYLFKRE